MALRFRENALHEGPHHFFGQRRPFHALELPIDARVTLLMHDYDFFVKDVPAFCERLDALRALRGNEVVNGWQEAARSGHLEGVVRDLLGSHYDPIYLASMQRNFSGFDRALVLTAPNGDAATLASVAQSLIARG